MKKELEDAVNFFNDATNATPTSAYIYGASIAKEYGALLYVAGRKQEALRKAFAFVPGGGDYILTPKKIGDEALAAKMTDFASAIMQGQKDDIKRALDLPITITVEDI